MPKRELDDNAIFADLETGLQIDRNNLDEIVEQHPSLYYEVSKRMAMLVSQRDAAKQYIKEIEGHVYLNIRNKARADGEKITENELAALQVTNKEVIKAHDTYAELSGEVGKWGALKDAYEQRSYAIKDEVQLYLANYYSEVSDAGPKMRRSYADDAKQAIGEERKRRYKA